jgi:hypothetical protein
MRNVDLSEAVDVFCSWIDQCYEINSKGGAGGKKAGGVGKGVSAKL